MKQNSLKNKDLTLKDIASLVGVSVITVSRALRQPELVSPQMRARIGEVVERVNFRPNEAARALAMARSSIIGVMIPSVTNQVFSDVLRGIYDEIEGSRFQIQLGNTHYTPHKELALLRIFASQRPAAMIISGLHHEGEALRLLERMNCPIVQVMDHGPPPFDMMVGVCHVKAGRAATQHLLDQGYRRIGFIAERLDTRAQRRRDGYRAAMSAAGLYDPCLETSSMRASSISRGRETFASFIDNNPDADAVFCYNDDMALGALFECQGRGIRVPQEMGIIGFNDLEFCATAVPALSSVHIDRYHMGRLSAEMALCALEGQEPPQRHIDMGFRVIARDSSRHE